MFAISAVGCIGYRQSPRLFAMPQSHIGERVGQISMYSWPHSLEVSGQFHDPGRRNNFKSPTCWIGAWVGFTAGGEQKSQYNCGKSNIGRPPIYCPTTRHGDCWGRVSLARTGSFINWDVWSRMSTKFIYPHRIYCIWTVWLRPYAFLRNPTKIHSCEMLYGPICGC
jgi:hypothetical protein